MLKTLLAACLLCLSTLAIAEEERQISDLGMLDRWFMDSQRQLMDEIVRNNFGSRFRGEKGSDLALLQRILDEGLVKGDQTRELQAMGVIIGDLLAADLDMHWVVYEDNVGRSRALRYRETESYLFPMTMISRRRAVDNMDSVREIYDKAYNTISQLRDPLPFQ